MRWLGKHRLARHDQFSRWIGPLIFPMGCLYLRLRVDDDGDSYDTMTMLLKQ